MDSVAGAFMIPLAKEGVREMVVATIVLGAMASVSIWLFWPAAIPFFIIWLWVLSFFRDPPRRRTYAASELCAPADGTVTEVSKLDEHGSIGGPAVRIGIFLSLFNVHINRAPCCGTVTRVTYRPGAFLDARHPDSGQRNESNTLLIDPRGSIPGPVEVRQVAGLVARRIICHAREGDALTTGSRFGLIKFGSRTELIIPSLPETEILVAVGTKVRGGLTILARQPAQPDSSNPKPNRVEMTSVSS